MRFLGKRAKGEIKGFSRFSDGTFLPFTFWILLPTVDFIMVFLLPADKMNDVLVCDLAANANTKGNPDIAENRHTSYVEVSEHIFLGYTFCVLWSLAHQHLSNAKTFMYLAATPTIHSIPIVLLNGCLVVCNRTKIKQNVTILYGQ